MMLRSLHSFGTATYRRSLVSVNQKRLIQLQPTAVVDTPLKKPETFEQKNARLKRPLSPHLTIYQPQLTWILSITHRITGFALVGYAGLIMSCGHLYEVADLITYIKSFQLSPTTLFIAKIILAAPFNYHLANGLRHLVWDLGFGFSLKTAYRTGYLTLLFTIISSIAMAAT